MKYIGRYEIIGRLGQGGMSTVYKAKAPVTGRVVALKVLKPRNEIFVELMGLEKLKEIFVEEARIMGDISHKHIAKVIDCDDVDGMPFIVLEYYAHSLGSLIGETYSVEMPSRVISERKVFFYLEQILIGIKRLHFSGIIHRDIKPFNLMVSDDDVVKIIDFGLSRVRGEEKMAIPGMQVGSPHYAAPEQERDPKRADGRADLYSLGVMAYRMLTGVLPEKDEKGILAPSVRNTAVNRVWDDFVLKGLQRNPDNRFDDANEMLLALHRVRRVIQNGGDPLCKPATSKSNITKNYRSEGVRIMYKDIRATLGLDDLMRPKSIFSNEWSDMNEEIAHHKETELLWQRQGAGFPLTWEQAKEYVVGLNKVVWKGREDWRLPTTEELSVILEPQQGFVQVEGDQILASNMHWLWSSDYCTKKQAWMVDIEENFIERLAMDGTASACAVCNS